MQGNKRHVHFQEFERDSGEWWFFAEKKIETQILKIMTVDGWFSVSFPKWMSSAP
jgi:hypothetical protein